MINKTVRDVVKALFGNFDFVLTGSGLHSLQAVIALQGACGEGTAIPFLPITATEELTHVGGRRIFLLGVTEVFGSMEYSSVVNQLKRLVDKGNQIVSVVDFTPEEFWPQIYSEMRRDFELPEWVDHCETVSVDHFFDGAYEWGYSVETTLRRKIIDATKTADMKFEFPEVPWEELELVWNSQTCLNPVFFQQLGLHYGLNRELEVVQATIVEANRQKEEAETAIREVVDLGKGVWKVNLPSPETAVTNVMAHILATKDNVKAVVGIENAGSGPFLKIQIYGDERDRFIAALGKQKIRFLYEQSKIPESMWPIRVHNSHKAKVVELLTPIH